jgi:hypothetical protein
MKSRIETEPVRPRFILAAQQAREAPALVLASAAAISSAGTASSGALATGVLALMTYAKIKLAAVIAIIQLFAGGVGAWVSTRQSHQTMTIDEVPVVGEHADG